MTSLRQKLLGGIGLPALLIAMTGVVLVSHRAREGAAGAERQEAQSLASLIRAAFTLVERAEAGDPAPATSPHRAVDAVLASEVFRRAGSVRVLSPRGKVLWSLQSPEVGVTMELRGGGRERTSRLTDRVLEVTAPLGGPSCSGCHLGAATLGEVQVSVREPALVKQVDADSHFALAAVLLLGSMFALATALSLQRFITRPLGRLSALMKRAERGDVLVRAEVRGDDEIAQLSSAFNRMLENMTAMKAEEIDVQRSLEMATEQLSLKQALESRVNDLSLLYDIARSLTATLELPELLARVSTIVATRLHFRGFSLMLLSPEQRLVVQVALPPTLESDAISFSLEEGACGLAARTRKTVYLPDLANTTLFVPRPPRQPQGSLLCIPIVHQSLLLGVLNFERPDPAAFDAGDIDLLTAVSDQVAMAIRNARLHEETVALSITDALTALPNRRYLFGRLEMELARAQRFHLPLSFIMVDIDHFKKLNDASGHRAGDVTLRQVADLLKAQVRKIDTLARYGGEEFALLLPQIGKSEAVEVAEKLRRAVSDFAFAFGAAQPTGKVTLSLGVAAYPEDAQTIDALIDAADASLYASKRGGRDLVTPYAPGMELHPGRERGPQVGRPSRPDLPILKV